MFYPAKWPEVMFSFLSYRLTMGGFLFVSGRLVVSGVLVLLVLLLNGCESAGVDSSSPTSGSSSSSSDGLSEHTFARAVELRFYDPINKRVVDTPFARLNEEEMRQMEALRQVRGQTDDGILEQIVTFGGATTERFLIQDDPGGIQVGFCSRTLDDPNFGPIKFRFDGSAGIGSEQEEVTFDVQMPPPEDGSELGTLLKLGASEFLPIDGNTISIVFTRDGLTINGQSIPFDDYVAPNDFAIGTWYPPVLKFTTPGVYTIQEAGAFGSFGVPYTFLLRRLEFQEEFPDYPSEPEGPIEIENSFAWSDGSPIEGAAWEVKESDGEAEINGLGTEISATWVPDERVFAQTIEDLEYEDVPFEVLARANSYLVQGSFMPYQISSEVDIPAAEAFQIVNERITTENPFEEPGVPVEMKADVVVIGLETLEEDIEWTVSIKDPEGNVVDDDSIKTTGFGPEVVAAWDGAIDGEFVEDPLSYSFFIEAQGCKDDGGIAVGRNLDSVRGQITIPGCFEALKNLSMTPFPTLRVYGQNRDRDFEFRSDLTPTAEKLNEVFTEGTLTFELTGTFLSIPEEQDTVNVILDANKSPQLQGYTLVLQRKTFDKFEAEFDLSLLLKNFSAPVESDIDSQAFYTCDTSDSPLDSLLFTLVLENRGQVQLGRSAGGADSTSILEPNTAEAITDNNNVTLPTKSAFRAMGYEVIEAKLSEPSIPTADNIKVRFRYKNQAPLTYFSGSGDHTANTLNLSNGEVISATNGDLTTTDFENVRTLILAGCPNLDINDYNDVHPTSTDTISLSSPGRDWDRLIPSEGLGVGARGNLLGYNGDSPATDSQQSILLDDFVKILDSGEFRNNAEMLDEVALAWLLANGQLTHHNSCAITARGYYFFRIKVGRNNNRGFGVPVRADKRKMSIKQAHDRGQNTLQFAQKRWRTRTARFVPRDVWSDISDPSELKAVHLEESNSRKIKSIDLEGQVITGGGL